MRQGLRWIHLCRGVLPLVAALSTSAALAQAANAVYAKVAGSIGIVIVSTFEGQLVASGSAVTVSSQTMVTNKHVLIPGHRYIVHMAGNKYEAYMTNCDAEQDLCLLSVQGLEAKPVEFADMDKVAVGDPVYAVGAPNEVINAIGVAMVTKQKAPSSMQLTLSNGLVTALRPVENGKIVQTNAAISPGSSGGGLFDANGHLVGITTFQMTRAQNINMALPVNWVERLGVTGSPRTTITSEVVSPGSPVPFQGRILEPAAPSASGENELPAKPPVPGLPSTSNDKPVSATPGFDMKFVWLSVPVVLLVLFAMIRRRRADAFAETVVITPSTTPQDPMRQRFIDQAADELDQSKEDRSLWNAVLADSKGNLNVARSAYIQQRSAKLMAAEKERLWAQAVKQSQGGTAT